MKKRALCLLALVLLTTSCGSIVARKDKSQIVKFENSKIVADRYDITFYKIIYPENPHDKDKFYEQFDILTSKMVAYGKDINMIIPLELYKDLLNLQKREVREGEKIYYKQAYSLTEEEKKFIDSKINVSTPNDAGEIQKYLNKQVAYWYDYLKKPEKYDGTRYYTELDKDRVVDEVFENRKFFSNTVFAVVDDLVIEVTENELEEVKDIPYPLYLATDSIPMEKLEGVDSKIIVLDGKLEDTVIPEKITLINNLKVENIKDYEISTNIIDIDNPLNLIPVIEEYQGLKLKDIQKFDIKHVPNSILKKASVKTPERKRQTIEFDKTESKWRIE